MGHKGYNGRVIALWLGDCMQRAVRYNTTPTRDFGQWFVQQGAWPADDSLLAPTAAAMPLVRSLSFSLVRLKIGNPFRYLSNIPLFQAIPLRMVSSSRKQWPIPAPRLQGSCFDGFRQS